MTTIGNKEGPPTLLYEQLCTNFSATVSRPSGIFAELLAVLQNVYTHNIVCCGSDPNITAVRPRRKLWKSFPASVHYYARTIDWHLI